MPIHGSIEEAGLADVLQLLALGRKSGCLAVSDGSNRGEIYLDTGRVTYAMVANRRDRLGDLLVKSGRITRQQLTAVAEEQERGSTRPLGKLLVESGRVSRATIERIVAQQVEEAVYAVFNWKQGAFTFTSEARPQHSLLSSLDPERLLLEGARRVDEWSLIEKKIPSFDMVYRQTRQRSERASEKDLTDEQRAILPLLDGTRDLHAVLELAAMDEFDVGKALYGLVMAGYAQLVERRTNIRHLDYRELLAYVVKEAEFADGQRRKAAGRHIADCPTCTERLRSIHVRQTAGSGTFPAVTDTEATPPAAPARFVDESARPTIESARPTIEAPPAAVEAPSLAAVSDPIAAAAAPPSVEPAAAADAPASRPPAGRRRQERRAGRDRRAQDRRAGLDRRREVRTDWSASQPERRGGPRRMAEARQDPARREVRLTEPRWAVTAVQEAAAEPAPAVPVAAVQPAPAIAPAPPRFHERRAPDATPRRRRGEGDPGEAIEWLVTPEESVEMIRASRSAMRISPTDLPRETTPSAAPMPEPVPEQRSQATPVAAAPATGSARRLPKIVSTPAPQSAAGGGARRSLVIPLPEVNLGMRTVRRAIFSASVAAAVMLAYAAGRRSGDGNAGAGAADPAAAMPSSAEAQAMPRGRAPVENPPAVESRATPLAAPPATRSAPAPVTPAGPRAPLDNRLAAATPAPGRAAAAPPGAAMPSPARPEPARPVPVESPAAQPAAAVPAPVPNPPVARTEPAPAPAAAAPEPAPVNRPPSVAPSSPDAEIASGGWAPVERAEAATLLGGGLAAIQGLPIESVTRSTAGARVRIRIVQIAETGERVVLTLTRAGAAVTGGAGPMRVTALRVIPPSEAYPQTTGTASVGNLLVTARSSIGAEALRALLERLGAAR